METKRKLCWKAIVLKIIMLLALTGIARATVIDVCDGEFTIQDGDWYDTINVWDSANVTMTGGYATEIGCFDTSVLNMSGGEIGSNLWALNQSIVNISSGSIYGVAAYNNATVNFSGGNISTTAMIANYSVFSMYGGTIDRLGAMDSSVINLQGGQIANWLGGSLDTIINVFGYNLAKTNTGGTYGDGQVTGFWQNDSPFIINLSGHDTYATVNLIPEPATFLLLGAGTFLLRKLRLKNNQNFC